MGIQKSLGRTLYEELRLLLKDTPEAIRRIKKICTHPDTDYLLVNDHIGDVVIVLGYLREYRKRKCIRNLTLVIPENYSGITNQYVGDYDRVQYIAPYDTYRAFLLNATRFGRQYLQNRFPNVTIVNPADSFVSGFESAKKYPEINLHKMIKCDCLGLDPETSFIPPRLQGLSHNHDAEIRKSRRVVFSMQSRTVKADIRKLCEILAYKFKTLGYELYTNTDDIKDCINGTKPVMSELASLGNFISEGIFVGVRNGLHDYLIYQDVTVIAIYPHNYDKFSLFTLDAMPSPRAAYCELMQSGDDDEDANKIMDFISEGRAY